MKSGQGRALSADGRKNVMQHTWFPDERYFPIFLIIYGVLLCH